ncbi:SMI1/KNR4 family protein [Kingella denitrificans]|uniref:SMI1/KNR4 family protein n=1 Tax=Kingella denitrificans TaxID=502 RepID=UPI0028CFEFC9|nr:SMI1/KNR4 family protein [Kingella denitrificans]
MKELVRRIMTQLEHLKQRFPEATAEFNLDYTLNAGAAEADFDRLEAVLGYALPEEFKELYRVADGESGTAGVLADEEWLSIERIIEEYGVWKTLLDDGMFADDDGTSYDCEPEDAAIKGDLWWNPKWIPLTADGSGNNKMIDMDPTEHGTAGQIIQMWHDDPARSKEADSLRGFLTQYAQDLEDGKYVLDTEYGLVLQSDLDEWRNE